MNYSDLLNLKISQLGKSGGCNLRGAKWSKFQAGAIKSILSQDALALIDKVASLF